MADISSEDLFSALVSEFDLSDPKTPRMNPQEALDRLLQAEELGVNFPQLCVVSVQNQYWEDSGGSHDPFITQLSEYEVDLIKAVKNICSIEEDEIDDAGLTPPEAKASRILLRVVERHFTAPTMPVIIHDCFTIWTY